MLHIHNGDSTADTAKQSTLSGEHFAWRESLITGPTPADLSDIEWRRIRAKHLSEAYGVNAEECEQSLLMEEKKLASFSQHEEVVLWFEHDLFCQVHLIYLLDWFSQRDLGKTKLSLICIGGFPGKENFRGLGELSPDELATLFPARQPVTDEQFALAKSAWMAFCSAKPNDIEKVCHANSGALPFLDAALQAHLKRFPSTKNGLGSIENRALRHIDEGLNSFKNLFARLGDTEPVYGLGDAQFWLALQRLSKAEKPLLKITNRNNGLQNSFETEQPQLTPEILKNAKFELTELGRSVLNGEADFIALNGIDLWLGGVHLHDRSSLWRWNDQLQTLVSG